MKIFSIILSMAILISCQNQTRVHLFSEGIPSVEVKYLSNELAESGYKVEINQLKVPPEITRHTVIYPALVEDFATVEAISLVLADFGFSNARLIRETEANHLFTSGNIGIYLIDAKNQSSEYGNDPYALGGSEASRLTYNYFSECPDNSEAQSELNIYPAGTAILEQFVWNEEDAEETSIFHEGEWFAESDSLTVQLYEDGYLRFSIKENSGTNWQGSYEGLTLLLEKSTVDLERCDYTHLRYNH